MTADRSHRVPSPPATEPAQVTSSFTDSTTAQKPPSQKVFCEQNRLRFARRCSVKGPQEFINERFGPVAAYLPDCGLPVVVAMKSDSMTQKLQSCSFVKTDSLKVYCVGEYDLFTCRTGKNSKSFQDLCIYLWKDCPKKWKDPDRPNKMVYAHMPEVFDKHALYGRALHAARYAQVSRTDQLSLLNSGDAESVKQCQEIYQNRFTMEDLMPNLGMNKTMACEVLITAEGTRFSLANDGFIEVAPKIEIGALLGAKMKRPTVSTKQFRTMLNAGKLQMVLQDRRYADCIPSALLQHRSVPEEQLVKNQCELAARDLEAKQPADEIETQESFWMRSNLETSRRKPDRDEITISLCDSLSDSNSDEDVETVTAFLSLCDSLSDSRPIAPRQTLPSTDVAAKDVAAKDAEANQRSDNIETKDFEMTEQTPDCEKVEEAQRLSKEEQKSPWFVREPKLKMNLLQCSAGRMPLSFEPAFLERRIPTSICISRKYPGDSAMMVSNTFVTYSDAFEPQTKPSKRSHSHGLGVRSAMTS